ncbi:MAG: HAD family hydrolase, partial [Acidimicrobiia bacterium]
DAILRFLDSAGDIPVDERVACFDNDGTLWCEKPTYIQFDFFVDAMKTAVGQDPALADKPEFAALLDGDQEATGAMGLMRIVHALAGLFAGIPPEEFTHRARQFMVEGQHADKGRPVRRMVYQPMLELIDELRKRDFTISVTTGGGTEFVRAVSQDLYGVPPELVVGSLIAYEYGRDDGGIPSLTRTAEIFGKPNEGPEKVANIQTQLGRRPIFAVGNSGGDREMLEWAVGGQGPRLALLVDHDDDEREYAYESKAVSFEEEKPIKEVAADLGWTVVSMANDWETVFPA